MLPALGACLFGILLIKLIFLILTIEKPHSCVLKTVFFQASDFNNFQTLKIINFSQKTTTIYKAFCLESLNYGESELLKPV